jgi:outer membrane protein assembly factor BamE (lipoprotein component of BamABCDE complex)
MKRMISVTFRWLSLSLPVLLVSCALDTSVLRPGVPAEQVRARLGAPTGTWRDGNFEVLEYATGPEGVQTFMVHLDASERIKEVHQVLNEEFFQRIEIGKSTKDEVRRLIGRPGLTSSTPRTGLEWWDYRYSSFGKMRLYLGFDQSNVVRQIARAQDHTEMNYDGGGGDGP